MVERKAAAWLCVGFLLSVLTYIALRPGQRGIHYYVNSDLATFLKACSDGDIKRIKTLAAKDPSLLDAMDEEGWTCLINASKYNRVDAVRLLLGMGASTGTEEMKHSALRGASIFGFVEIVRLLLDAGAIVDVFSSYRKTPLMGAAMNGHTEVVKMLLEAGANPALRNDYGETAYDLALRNHHLDIVQFLKEASEVGDSA